MEQWGVHRSRTNPQSDSGLSCYLHALPERWCLSEVDEVGMRKQMRRSLTREGCWRGGPRCPGGCRLFSREQAPTLLPPRTSRPCQARPAWLRGLQAIRAHRAARPRPTLPRRLGRWGSLTVLPKHTWCSCLATSSTPCPSFPQI